MKLALFPRRTSVGILICCVIGLAGFLGGLFGTRLEFARQASLVSSDALLQRELLRSEFERHRLLPSVLAGDGAVANALYRNLPEQERSARHAALNQRFQTLSRYDGAATLYLIGTDGVTVAASNFDSPRSFVGQDYSGRSYFRDAMRDGVGQLFAEGTVSRVPGLYLARRLDSGAGVVVVKVEFGQLEQSWRRAGERTLVSDESGQTILTSVPALRFQRWTANPSRDVVSASVSTGIGWTLHMERDVGARLFEAGLVGAAISGLVAAMLCLILERLQAKRAERLRAHLALREEVLRRTAELRDTNHRLQQEIDERNRSEAQLQRVRNDLINANRLAVVGQIAAGVAHEINQPVTAIRGLVDNAKIFLARNLLRDVESNLTSVSSMTERIGIITRELRTYSRQEAAVAEPVLLSHAIDGALALIRPVLSSNSVLLSREDQAPSLVVQANRIRLEQVLMNLLQNASEAVRHSDSPQLRICSGPLPAGGAWVEIDDNGPGVADDRVEKLFTPFETSKPDGLGLGLVICRDILAEYGGSLEYTRSDLGGARFRIRLAA